MLVIFAYFVALIPNQSLNIIYIFFIIFFIFFVLIFISFIYNMKIDINILYIRQINIIYEITNIKLLIILALVLLFTIILVVKIVRYGKGPFRPFNYV